MLRLAGAAAAGTAAFLMARTALVLPARERARTHRTRGARHLPPRLRRWLEDALRDATITMAPEDAAWTAATILGVAALVTAAVNPLLVPLVVGLVAVGAPVGLALARGRAQRAFVAALPGFVDVTAARLRSGHTVSTALHDAGQRADPVAGDARRIAQRLELGAPLRDALARWAEERRLDPVRAVAGALAVAAQTGGAAAGALEGLARSLRDQAGARADAAALSAQARTSAIVVGTAPLLYLLFSAVVDPHSATILVTSTGGRICLALGLALDTVGAWWMRAIVRSEP